MTCCPTCGAQLRPAALRYDEEAGIVMVNGHAVQLTMSEGRLFKALLDRFPRPMMRYDLLDAMYTTEADWPSDKIIDVFVLKINRKLKDCGWHVGSLYQRGFCLAQGEYVPMKDRKSCSK